MASYEYTSKKQLMKAIHSNYLLLDKECDEAAPFKSFRAKIRKWKKYNIKRETLAP